MATRERLTTIGYLPQRDSSGSEDRMSSARPDKFVEATTRFGELRSCSYLVLRNHLTHGADDRVSLAVLALRTADAPPLTCRAKELRHCVGTKNCQQSSQQGDRVVRDENPAHRWRK